MRERLKSRLGFLMLAAASAVGLGNVWRFPYIVGKNGGAAFVLFYLFFLAVLGFPVLAAELAIGRGAKRSIAVALPSLAPPRARRFWTRAGAVMATGCLVLMMYYTDVAGWLFNYTGVMARGAAPTTPEAASATFGALCASPATCGAYMLLGVVAATLVCFFGVAKGVERVTKGMMLALLALLAMLAVKALTLPGAAEGLAFYLKPDWTHFLTRPWAVIFDAMGQAFFTLSLGVGSMTICGSYVSEERSLVTESVLIIVIDTAVALLAGLILFPVCFTYGVDQGTAGPGLIFIALPQVFAQMEGGRFWGFIFFLFLACAALTTIIAVFEALIAGLMDALGMRRVKATCLVGAGVALLSLPCVLWEGVLKWEDFAVSQLWIPIGGLLQAFFVVNGTYGWGWEKFRAAVSAGKGWTMPRAYRPVYACLLPALILIVLFVGLITFGYAS